MLLPVGACAASSQAFGDHRGFHRSLQVEPLAHGAGRHQDMIEIPERTCWHPICWRVGPGQYSWCAPIDWRCRPSGHIQKARGYLEVGMGRVCVDMRMSLDGFVAGAEPDAHYSAGRPCHQAAPVAFRRTRRIRGTPPSAPKFATTCSTMVLGPQTTFNVGVRHLGRRPVSGPLLRADPPRPARAGDAQRHVHLRHRRCRRGGGGRFCVVGERNVEVMSSAVPRGRSSPRACSTSCRSTWSPSCSAAGSGCSPSSTVTR